MSSLCLSPISGSDVSSSFMALRSLGSDIEASPHCVSLETVQSLQRALLDRSFASQTCASFVYQETARILGSIMVLAPRPEVRLAAHHALEGCALQTLGNPCMAAAQALGTLPVSLPKHDPGPALSPDSSPPRTTFNHLLNETGLKGRSLQWAGRNLLVSDPGSDTLLVLKCARDRENLEGLHREAAWMAHLAEEISFPARCELPKPFIHSGHPLLQVSLPTGWQGCCLTGSPSLGQPEDKRSDRVVLPYVVSRDYFVYPNEPGQLPGPVQLGRMLGNAAFNLGHLSAQGILHSAAIPLFHNRTQQTRRDDGGRYIWTRKGRLDRWLHSCRFPNFGLSGLRDFEHLRLWSGQGRDLFIEVGAQLLSLLLVAGSTFRSRAPERVGLDQNGAPCDCRDLFDPDLLSELVSLIVTSFHQGFTGRSMQAMPGSLQHLVERMIEELGVDRHMTETLRVRDQEAMSASEFADFLSRRGVPGEELANLTQATRDLTLVTGPHLGDFNGPISLPELIDFTAAAAAVCISSTFLAQTRHDHGPGRAFAPEPALSHL